MEKVFEKLENMKLKINKDKSDVVHGNSENIKFLGVYIRYFQNKKKIDESETDDITKQVNKLVSQSVISAQFRAPIDKITIRLAEKKLAKKLENGRFRATAYMKYSMFEDDIIVKRFSAIVRGIINYYSCINKRSDL